MPCSALKKHLCSTVGYRPSNFSGIFWICSKAASHCYRSVWCVNAATTTVMARGKPLHCNFHGNLLYFLWNFSILISKCSATKQLPTLLLQKRFRYYLLLHIHSGTHFFILSGGNNFKTWSTLFNFCNEVKWNVYRLAIIDNIEQWGFTNYPMPMKTIFLNVSIFTC